MRDDGSVAVRLAGWAYLTKVDLSQVKTSTELLLRNQRTGEECVFAARDQPQLAFPPPVEDVWCDYEPGSFGVEIPVGDVLDSAAPDDIWGVWLRITVGEFSVTRPVKRLLRNSGATVTQAHRRPDGSRLIAAWTPDHPLGFRMEAPGVQVRDLAVGARTLTGRVTGDGWEIEQGRCRSAPRAREPPVASRRPVRSEFNFPRS